ncbi:hypothetical protein KDH_31880 [Dictyobacter sp. S3.2.2.5]|uniref:Uncharacterized protein n=1 Tax=Dictyobacter halimunensis TaxID=3026934 RepID=A0ABQ6FPZ0_9CHLR|nr:hypothetical protein KDH_31880 [Dictyobacter sp. S3.2.2.5]
MAETAEDAVAKQTDPEQKHVSRENLEWLLKKALKVPRVWLVLSIIFVVLSIVEINETPHAGFSFAIHVTSTTPIFLALVWLPALLTIFALVGGAAKTPAGEISSPGLSDLARIIGDEELGILLEKTAEGQEKGASPIEREKAQQFNKQLQEIYVSRIPITQRRRELENMAREYEYLRRRLLPSGERTLEMESLWGRIQALAPKAHLSSQDILSYLASEGDGERILGLAIAFLSPEPAYFEPLLPMIDGKSHSAFEQHRALLVAEALVPKLNRAQREKLRNCINNQRNYDPSKKRWIAPGIDRDYISMDILEAIEQKDRTGQTI